MLYPYTKLQGITSRLNFEKFYFQLLTFLLLQNPCSEIHNCIISSQPNTNINITNSNMFVALGKIMFIEWIETGPLTACLKDSKFYKQIVDLLTKLTWLDSMQ